MIIQSSAIKTTSGSGVVARHILKGEQNEKIELLQGGATSMSDYVADAKLKKFKYGFVHFKICPQESLTETQMMECVDAVLSEFTAGKDDATIVMHTKPRADGVSFDKHIHLCVPYYQYAQKRALNLKNSYARQEKVARLCELNYGHRLITGAHNLAVMKTLESEGKHEEALRIQGRASSLKPQNAHTLKQQKRLENQGVSLPVEKHNIKKLWSQSDGLKAFASSLASEGYILKEGTKRNTYIIQRDDVLIGAAHRLMGMRKADFVKLYKEDVQDDRAYKTKEPRRDVVGPKPRQRAALPSRAHEDHARDEHDCTSHIGVSRRATDGRAVTADGIVAAHSRPAGYYSAQPRSSAFTLAHGKIIERELVREERRLRIVRHKTQSIFDAETALQRLIELILQLFKMIFGILTPEQSRTQVVLVADVQERRVARQTIERIIRVEMPKFTTVLEAMSESVLRETHHKQCIFIERLNGTYGISLPIASWTDFLRNNQPNNPLCGQLLADEMREEEVERAQGAYEAQKPKWYDLRGKEEKEKCGEALKSLRAKMQEAESALERIRQNAPQIARDKVNKQRAENEAYEASFVYQGMLKKAEVLSRFEFTLRHDDALRSAFRRNPVAALDTGLKEMSSNENNIPEVICIDELDAPDLLVSYKVK